MFPIPLSKLIHYILSQRLNFLKEQQDSAFFFFFWYQFSFSLHLTEKKCFFSLPFISYRPKEYFLVIFGAFHILFTIHFLVLPSSAITDMPYFPISSAILFSNLYSVGHSKSAGLCSYKGSALFSSSSCHPFKGCSKKQASARGSFHLEILFLSFL